MQKVKLTRKKQKGTYSYRNDPSVQEAFTKKVELEGLTLSRALQNLTKAVVEGKIKLEIE